MIQVLAVLVPLAVALVTTLRWPTLQRRVREHAAIAKELPPEAKAEPLHNLLAREVAELARREQSRLDTRGERKEKAIRFAVIVGTGLWSSTLLLFQESSDAESILSSAWWRPFAVVYGIPLVVGAVFAFLWWYVGLAIGRFERRRAAERGNRSQQR